MSTAAITKALAGDARQLRDGPLYLRIHQGRTRGTFYLVTTKGGVTRWHRIGRWPDIDAAELRRQLPSMLAKAAADGGAVSAPDTFATVGDLLDWYATRVAEDRGLKKVRVSGVSGYIRNHLSPALGDVPLAGLDRITIDRNLTWPMQKNKYAPSTVKQVFQSLKCAMRMAERTGRIGSNPLATVMWKELNPHPDKPKPGKLKPHHLPSLLVDLAEWSTLDAGVYALLCLLHGTRRGETVRARWEDVDLSAMRWHLPPENVKTGKKMGRGHDLAITPAVASLLTNWRQHLERNGREHGGWLFPGRRVGRTVTHLSDSAISERVKELSGGKWSSHDLRKLARTCWAEIGVDYIVGEMLLNHAMRNLDKTYIQTHAERQCRAALERWHQHLFGLGLRHSLIRYDLDGERAA